MLLVASDIGIEIQLVDIRRQRLGQTAQAFGKRNAAGHPRQRSRRQSIGPYEMDQLLLLGVGLGRCGKANLSRGGITNQFRRQAIGGMAGNRKQKSTPNGHFNRPPSRAINKISELLSSYHPQLSLANRQLANSSSLHPLISVKSPICHFRHILRQSQWDISYGTGHISLHFEIFCVFIVQIGPFQLVRLTVIGDVR